MRDRGNGIEQVNFALQMNLDDFPVLACARGSMGHQARPRSYRPSQTGCQRAPLLCIFRKSFPTKELATTTPVIRVALYNIRASVELRTKFLAGAVSKPLIWIVGGIFVPKLEFI